MTAPCGSQEIVLKWNNRYRTEKGENVMSITREQAHDILMKYMKGEAYIQHSYAVEAIMKGLAKRLAPGEEEFWGIVGLLHDLDEEQCDWKNHPEVHGPTSVEILKKEGVEDKVLHDAICAHNPKSGVKAKTTLQYAVLAADPMSGFVKAVAQIYPDKKIASVKHKSVMKRFNEARFAAGANRDYMESIEFTKLIKICFHEIKENHCWIYPLIVSHSMYKTLHTCHV